MIRETHQSDVPRLTALEESSEVTPLVPPLDKSSAELTPFMRQWTAAKRENPDALLFFRMGDFYELFYDDAVVVSRELQLTLTARDRERNQPMCGVPYHAVEGYLTRLLRKGYRIAICDQMEDPKLTKKIVRREVTRVLTPGTALDDGAGTGTEQFSGGTFEAEHPEKRASVPKGPGDIGPGSLGVKAQANHAHPTRTGNVCAVALLDVSTGEFRTAEFQGAKCAAAGGGRNSDGGCERGSCRFERGTAGGAGADSGADARGGLGVDARFCGAAGGAAA